MPARSEQSPDVEPLDGARPELELLGAGPDQECVARVRAGDRGAIEGVFRAHYGGLCAFATRYVGDTGVAEEIVQDVLRRVWEQRVRWVVRGSVATYLYGAVRNGVVGHVRRVRVAERWAQRSARDAASDPDRTQAPAADAATTRAEVARAIEQAATALPPKAQQVFLLKWAHGLTVSEIAGALGLSPKTVEMHLTRSYKALREQLTDYFP